MQAEFDVFLSYNSQDRLIVEKIGESLRAVGLRVWLDRWEPRPGFRWQERLQEGIQASRAVAVFVGAAGLGAWQELEIQAFIARSRKDKIPVIPVLLPGCPDSPQLSLFLEGLTGVDLREGLTDAGLARLVWGITGGKEEEVSAPGRANAAVSTGLPNHMKAPVAWRTWGLALSLVIAVMTTGTWIWKGSKPALYEVRVQVLDPQGRPVARSTVRASAGNEPHLLPDGWWEVQIPAAKVPAESRISLWAEHADWDGNRIDLRLGMDPNPQVEIRLKQPETWIRGRVVDQRDRSLSGVRITRQDGAAGEAITDADGRFALKLALPRDKLIRLRSVYEDWLPGDDYCYTGRDSCPILLGAR